MSLLFALLGNPYAILALLAILGAGYARYQYLKWKASQVDDARAEKERARESLRQLRLSRKVEDNVDQMSDDRVRDELKRMRDQDERG